MSYIFIIKKSALERKGKETQYEPSRLRVVQLSRVRELQQEKDIHMFNIYEPSNDIKLRT